jgi:hypothetical protein
MEDAWVGSIAPAANRCHGFGSADTEPIATRRAGVCVCKLLIARVSHRTSAAAAAREGSAVEWHTVCRTPLKE